MTNINYKIGYFFGLLCSIFIVSYAIYDGYLNYRDGDSIAANLALLFAYFVWRKQFMTNSILHELFLNEVSKRLEKEEDQ